jgi:hypothetical protein
MVLFQGCPHRNLHQREDSAWQGQIIFKKNHPSILHKPSLQPEFDETRGMAFVRTQGKEAKAVGF